MNIIFNVQIFKNLGAVNLQTLFDKRIETIYSNTEAIRILLVMFRRI